MELVLFVAVLAAVPAGCWWMYRSVRRKQRRGELTNAPPRTYGELMLPGYDHTEGRAAENYIEQIDPDDRSRGFRLGDN
ncbi:hypothetical protein ACWCW7_10445 [Nocardia tengchongensis]